MSLFGALSASLTSLTAQSSAVNSISNNIANLSTTGFKSTSVSFATLVTGNIGGGVIQGFRNDVDSQGSIESTGVGTDLALQGSGFFSVQDVSGNLLYTRAGSFRTDSTGNLVNEAGYKLMGWPLDSEERLPGEGDNTTFTTTFSNTESLTNVSTATITGTASPTTAIDTKINLQADIDILEGSGDTVVFPSTSSNNGISSTAIITPNGNMAIGDVLTIAPGEGSTLNLTYGGFSRTTDPVAVATPLAGATTSSATMTGLTDGDDFTITVNSDDAITFSFKTTPDLDSNEFSNLNELAQIINASSGLTSRVGDDDRLYIAADSVGSDIIFADPNTSGLITTLNLTQTTINGDSSTFATLEQLNTLINGSADFLSSVSSPSGNATLKVSNIDSTDTVTFSDDVTGNDLLDDFSLGTSTIAATYDPASTTTPFKSIASGNISADFSRNLTVYTSLGEGLDLSLSFVKLIDGTSSTGGQTWGVELHAVKANDIIGRDDGLLAYGEVTFDGTGALSAYPTSFSSIDIQPSGGAAALDVSLNLGTIGETDGLSQFAGQFSVDELSQNGFPTGRLQSLQIDAQGFVTAIFDNSLTSKVYKLPIAHFSNPNGLTPESGNAYSSNNSAGEVTLGQVGDASVGTIVPSALEVSTAEIGTELTNLIISQQAYSASANVLRKVSELFDKLEQL